MQSEDGRTEQEKERAKLIHGRVMLGLGVFTAAAALAGYLVFRTQTFPRLLLRVEGRVGRTLERLGQKRENPAQ